MRIGRGIPGIKTHRTTDRAGWHLIVDDRYEGYSEAKLSAIIDEGDATDVLADIVGNNLHIITTEHA